MERVSRKERERERERERRERKREVNDILRDGDRERER